eukprot:tig00000310_g23987.t1
MRTAALLALALAACALALAQEVDLDRFCSPLPVLVVTAGKHGIESGSDRSNTHVSLHAFEAPCGAGGDRRPLFDVDAKAHARTDARRGFPEFMYALKTTDSDGKEKAVPLLGMPSHSRWALYGALSAGAALYPSFWPATDPTQASGTGTGASWAPRVRYVEAFFARGKKDRPQYAGVWLVMETVRPSEHRVDLGNETAAGEGSRPWILTVSYENLRDGGGSVEAEAAKRAARQWWILATGYKFVWPRPKAVENGIAGEARRALLRLRDAIVELAGRGPWRAASAVDLASFVDYFLLRELQRDADGVRKNQFYVRRAGERALRMGPLWDCELGFNRTFRPGFSLCGQERVEGFAFLYPDLDCRPPAFWLDLLRGTTFPRAAASRWHQLRAPGAPLSPPAIDARVEGRHARRWPEASPRTTADWEREVRAVATWLRARTPAPPRPARPLRGLQLPPLAYLRCVQLRGAWLDRHIDSLGAAARAAVEGEGADGDLDSWNRVPPLAL